jgi:hypothetical protein
VAQVDEGKQHLMAEAEDAFASTACLLFALFVRLMFSTRSVDFVPCRVEKFPDGQRCKVRRVCGPYLVDSQSGHVVLCPGSNRSKDVKRLFIGVSISCRSLVSVCVR